MAASSTPHIPIVAPHRQVPQITEVQSAIGATAVTDQGLWSADQITIAKQRLQYYQADASPWSIKRYLEGVHHGLKGSPTHDFDHMWNNFRIGGARYLQYLHPRNWGKWGRALYTNKRYRVELSLSTDVATQFNAGAQAMLLGMSDGHRQVKYDQLISRPATSPGALTAPDPTPDPLPQSPNHFKKGLPFDSRGFAFRLASVVAEKPAFAKALLGLESRDLVNMMLDGSPYKVDTSRTKLAEQIRTNPGEFYQTRSELHRRLIRKIEEKIWASDNIMTMRDLEGVAHQVFSKYARGEAMSKAEWKLARAWSRYVTAIDKAKGPEPAELARKTDVAEASRKIGNVDDKLKAGKCAVENFGSRAVIIRVPKKAKQFNLASATPAADLMATSVTDQTERVSRGLDQLRVSPKGEPKSLIHLDPPQNLNPSHGYQAQRDIVKWRLPLKVFFHDQYYSPKRKAKRVIAGYLIDGANYDHAMRPPERLQAALKYRAKKGLFGAAEMALAMGATKSLVGEKTDLKELATDTAIYTGLGFLTPALLGLWGAHNMVMRTALGNILIPALGDSISQAVHGRDVSWVSNIIWGATFMAAHFLFKKLFTFPVLIGRLGALTVQASYAHKNKATTGLLKWVQMFTRDDKAAFLVKNYLTRVAGFVSSTGVSLAMFLGMEAYQKRQSRRMIVANNHTTFEAAFDKEIILSPDNVAALVAKDYAVVGKRYFDAKHRLNHFKQILRHQYESRCDDKLSDDIADKKWRDLQARHEASIQKLKQEVDSEKQILLANWIKDSVQNQAALKQWYAQAIQPQVNQLHQIKQTLKAEPALKQIYALAYLNKQTGMRGDVDPQLLKSCPIDSPLFEGRDPARFLSFLARLSSNQKQATVWAKSVIPLCENSAFYL